MDFKVTTYSSTHQTILYLFQNQGRDITTKRHVPFAIFLQVLRIFQEKCTMIQVILNAKEERMEELIKKEFG